MSGVKSRALVAPWLYQQGAHQRPFEVMHIFSYSLSLIPCFSEHVKPTVPAIMQSLLKISVPSNNLSTGLTLKEVFLLAAEVRP